MGKGRELTEYYPLRYLTGETLSATGQASLPSECRFFAISAETAEVYYAMNAAFATVDAPGFVPINGYRLVGPIGNLSTLHINVTGGKAHIEYYH